MRLSISDLKHLAQDPVRFFLANPRYGSGRVPRKRSPALDAGRMWHKFCERLLTGASKEEATRLLMFDALTSWETLMSDGDPDRASKLKRETDSLLALAVYWEPPQHVKILAVEQPIVTTIGTLMSGEPFELEGRPDLTTEQHEAVWHEQHRSLGPSVPIATYMEAAVRDWHERGYAVLHRAAYPQYRTGGTVFDLVRKLSPKTIHEKPSAAMQRLPIIFEDWLIDEAVRDFLALGELLDRFLKKELVPWNVPALDRGPWGNSIDAYFPVLIGARDLQDDDYFEPAEDRYAEPSDE